MIHSLEVYITLELKKKEKEKKEREKKNVVSRSGIEPRTFGFQSKHLHIQPYRLPEYGSG